MIRKKGTFVLFFILVFISHSCIKENIESLSTVCGDVEEVSYSLQIVPILNTSCTSCHNQISPDAGVALDTYEDVAVYAANGSLLNSIKHEPGYSPMPQGQSKLDSCNIQLIESWINAGYPDN